jgi:hypothetical protein
MRKITIFLVLAAAFAAVTAAWAGTDEIRTRIGQEYGLDRWDDVEELRYTFNVRSGEREVRRSWVWRVKKRTVTFRDDVAGGEAVTYSLDDIGEDISEDLKKIDSRFINDQYWLLFALHVAWDTGAEVTAADGEPLPIGDGTATKVTVQYPEEGGYTPGDAYDVFVGEDGRVVQWVFRQGGQPEPSLATTWEDQRAIGPLVIPTRFRSADDSFELWFSDVELITLDAID